MSIDRIISNYDAVVRVIDAEACEQDDRAYGGMVRAVKGKLQEFITEEIIKLAWSELGGRADRLTINSSKLRLPIQSLYVDSIPNVCVRNYIRENIATYHYGLSVDKHIFIDGIFVMGIECKAYTENAMIKRILVDFHLLKTLYPDISCHLFQLESQLGGDYSELPETVYGSKSTHSIMSYFNDVELHITTLLKGERDINNPIHKNFKPLERSTLERAVEFTKSFLRAYVSKVTIKAAASSAEPQNAAIV